MQADHFSTNASQNATGLTPPEAGSFARATRPAARLRPLAFVILSLLLIQPALAGPVRLYFQSNTNSSTLDTNVLIATPISANILANGGVIAQGLPFRINNPSGVVTQSFNVGWFSISNRALGRGIVINVYDSSSTLYDLTNVLQSGFNTYKVTVYGTNPPPTYDEITNSLGYVPLGTTQGTNAWTAADTVVSNGLFSFIAAATNSGITAATGTNISAYQALLTSNGLSARLIATNAALASAISTTSNTLSARLDTTITNGPNFDVNNLSFVTDSGTYVFNTGGLALGGSLKYYGRGELLTNAAGYTFASSQELLSATNNLNTTLGTRLNATNTLILTTLTNNLTASSNGLSGRLLATNTSLVAQLNSASNTLRDFTIDATNELYLVLSDGDLVVSNGLSARLTGTNTLLTTRITDATNSLAGAISNRYNNADTVVSNGLYALIDSGAGGGIATANGSGTNTTLYFNKANWGTNNSNATISGNDYGAIISGTSNTVSSGATTANTILGGAFNSIGTQTEGTSVMSGSGNAIANEQKNSTISGGSTNNLGFTGANNAIASGAYNRIGGATGSGAGNIISGGYSNMISGPGGGVGGQPYYSAIPGGLSNVIYGGVSYSFAAGHRATIAHSNSFVWSDPAAGTPFTTTGTNQFLIRAAGGVAINTNDPAGNSLRVAGATATDRLALGARELIQATTNIIAVTNAGTASANGLFRNVNSTHYTNDFTGSVLTNNTAGNWQIKNGITVLYSGSTPITTTTIQSGASPAPTSAFGNYFNADGTVFRGVVSSTNIDQRIQSAVSTYGSSVVSQSVASGTNTFAGNGSGLTNVTASGISGVVKIIHNGIASGDYTSITNALASAVAGDTVWAISGTFTNNNLLKAGVHIKGEPSANILFVQSATNDPGWGIFDDRTTGPTTNIIEWPGSIEFIGCTNVSLFPAEDEIFNPNPNTRGVIVMTNAASKLTIRGGSVSGSKMSSVGGMGILYFSAGTSDVTLTEITNRQHGLSYDVGLQAFSTTTTGIKTENGNHVIRVPWLSGELYAWEWRATGATTTNDVVIRSDMVKGICYGSSDVPETRGWFYASEIDGTYSPFLGVVSISCYGSGKFYWDVLKVKSQLGAVAIDTAAGESTSNVVVWVTAQKIESDNRFVNARVGEVYVTAQDWKFTGTHMAQGILNSGNGQVFPFYSIGGKTNISAAASSIGIIFQKPLPSTNYSLTLNHNFNPVASYYVSARTRTNCVVTYSTGVTTGGQIDYTATVQAQ